MTDLTVTHWLLIFIGLFTVIPYKETRLWPHLAFTFTAFIVIKVSLLAGMAP